MDNNLHKKIFEVLTSVNGLSADNTFFYKADVNVKILPRYIFSSVSTRQEYDTKDRYDTELIQVSMFCPFQSGDIFKLRNKANLITNSMTKENLSGTLTNGISRCKLDNYRESESEKIFQIDLTFRITINKGEI